MNHPEHLVLSVAEAISALGYLKSDAAPTISRLIAHGSDKHPKAIATEYRGSGTQLTNEEKKAIGLRTNAVMSHEALEDMTELGRQRLLEAHYQTILRANFSVLRHRRLTELTRFTQAHAAANALYDAIFSDHCATCARLHNTKVELTTWPYLPPSGCQIDGCNVSFRGYIDYSFGLT